MKRKIGLYGLNVGVGALVSLGAIPVIIAAAGPTVWGAIAAAQAMGAIAAIIIEFGWGYVGPAEVAARSGRDRPSYLGDSLAARLWIATAALPLCAAATFLIVPSSDAPVAATIAATSVAFQGLASPWYYVGCGDPRRLLIADTLPRAAGTTLGMGALLLGGGILAFAVIQLLGAVLPFLYSALRVAAPPADWERSAGGIRRRLARNLDAVVTAIAAAAYGLLPTIVVAGLARPSLPTYALADKFSKYALVAMQPVVQLSQGYVPAARTRQELISRSRRTVGSVSVVSVLAGLVAATCAPIAAEVMTQGQIELSWSLAIAMGVIVSSILMTGVIGLACLVALGRTRTVAVSTVVGAGLGLPLSIVGAEASGAEGVAWSVAVAELAVLLVQAAALRGEFRKGPK